MNYAVCTVPVAAIRNEPSHKAEMVSQLLFGECCTFTETTRDGFTKITVKADAYEGWCQLQHVTTVSEDVYRLSNAPAAGGWVNNIEHNGTLLHIPFGSTLQGIQEGKMHWGSGLYRYNGALHHPAAAVRNAATITGIAFTFLNTPYLWGGRSVFGIDCSGFTQVVYKLLDIALPRDAWQQAGKGSAVDFLQQAQCGDLAFFDNAAGDIVHTGVLLNDHEIIHASGSVRVDDIDNGGIVNRQTGLRTQKLRIIKRLF